MNTGKVILGTLAGFAVGTIAGILFAPEKGSTTLLQIKDKRDEYVDELKSKFNDFRDSLTELFKSAKTDAEKLFDKEKAKYEDAENDVKNAAANIKNATS